MTELCQIEIDTLRAAADEVGGLRWNGAGRACLERLMSAGLVTRGPRFLATRKGRDLLASLDSPADRSAT